MEKKFYCFDCNCEYLADENLEVCQYCESEDVMLSGPTVEFDECDSYEISDEDVLEWQYGNDYHKFVKE